MYTCVYDSHKASQNSSKQECNLCSYLPGFPLFWDLFLSSFSLCGLQTKTKKYLYHQHPCGSSNLICTFNLTLNFFCALTFIWKGLKLAKCIPPHFFSMSLKLPGYWLDTDHSMLIGYHITGGCPSPDPFQLIGQSKHMTVNNWEWANWYTRTLRDHNAIVMSKNPSYHQNFDSFVVIHTQSHFKKIAYILQ